MAKERPEVLESKATAFERKVIDKNRNGRKDCLVCVVNLAWLRGMCRTCYNRDYRKGGKQNGL